MQARSASLLDLRLLVVIATAGLALVWLASSVAQSPANPWIGPVSPDVSAAPATPAPATTVAPPSIAPVWEPATAPSAPAGNLVPRTADATPLPANAVPPKRAQPTSGTNGPAVFDPRNPLSADDQTAPALAPASPSEPGPPPKGDLKG